MVDLARPHECALRRYGDCGHTVRVAAEEVHLFGLPLLDADLVAHRVDDVLAIGVHFETADCGSYDTFRVGLRKGNSGWCPSKLLFVLKPKG